MSVVQSPMLTPRAAYTPSRLSLRSCIVSGDPLSARMPHSARAGAVTPVTSIQLRAGARSPATPIMPGARSPATPLAPSVVPHSPRAGAVTPVTSIKPRAGACSPVTPSTERFARVASPSGVCSPKIYRERALSPKSVVYAPPARTHVASSSPARTSPQGACRTPRPEYRSRQYQDSMSETHFEVAWVSTETGPPTVRSAMTSASPVQSSVLNNYLTSEPKTPSTLITPASKLDHAQLEEDKNLSGKVNNLITPAAKLDHAKLMEKDLEEKEEQSSALKNYLTSEPKTPSTLINPASKLDHAQLEEDKNPSGKVNNLITPAAKFDHAKLMEKDLEEKEEHLIFNWLAWAPEPSSLCYQALHKHFPGALPGEVVNNRIKNLLQGEQYGFKKANTLVGYSLCPDEINYEPGCLVDLMKKAWGHAFPLGGISGTPFVGVTGFGAFSHHVPDDGNIIIIFGPHVALSREGLIGKVRREGQHHLSTACGAVIGAYNACSAACNSNKDDEDEYDPADMQMGWIKSQLQAHVGLIEAQPNPMAALAYQAYEMVKAKLESIVNLDFGSGKLVLIGGIQINMPDSFEEHFLPLSLDLRQKGKPSLNLLSAFDCDFSKERIDFARDWTPPIEGGNMSSKDELSIAIEGDSSNVFKEFCNMCFAANFDHSVELAFDQKRGKQHAIFAWLSWSPEPGTPVFNTLHREFPGALPGPGVHHRLKMVLTEQYGFTPSNTLFGTSICPDEINNEMDDLARLMAMYWGSVFPLGGLAGVPFAGKTGFKAFSHHVPVNGDIIVLYGPHVGISASGEVGKFPRLGQKEESTACGACIGAYNACVAEGGGDFEFDEVDIQMSFIKSQLAPHAKRIQRQQCPMAALAYQAFEVVKNKINKVVNTEFGSGRLVLIGGIQINMPKSGDSDQDHFLPLSCEVQQAGKPTCDISSVFHATSVSDFAGTIAGA